MSYESRAEMNKDQRDAFLGDGGTGVLSLSVPDGPPHSVPVSYGYDKDDEWFYFRLAVGANTSKGELTDRPATFVTYDERGEEWHSVVARGQLQTVESGGTAALDGLSKVNIPLIDSFERPIRETTFEFYQLVPTELTGRIGEQ